MAILNIILLIILNFYIARFLVEKKSSDLGYALIPVIVFIILNLLFSELPKKVIPITLFYSFSLLIMGYMISIFDIVVTNLTIKKEVIEKFLKVKYYMFNFIMPILISFFQIILMLNKEMQNKL